VTITVPARPAVDETDHRVRRSRQHQRAMPTCSLHASATALISAIGRQDHGEVSRAAPGSFFGQEGPPFMPAYASRRLARAS